MLRQASGNVVGSKSIGAEIFGSGRCERGSNPSVVSDQGDVESNDKIRLVNGVDGEELEGGGDFAGGAFAAEPGAVDGAGVVGAGGFTGEEEAVADGGGEAGDVGAGEPVTG